MARGTAFTQLNALELGKDGVFHDSEYKEFAYSDGAEVEQTLFRILSDAKDLSSSSKELDALITDWPTEYHLSSSRANLLRGLNLDGVKNVLELGCGCGSISRYLGEQERLRVDSIEGSEIRASLAALRCCDLPNVAISCGNFNSMKFPLGHYDLVLFVGVTEYAGRFAEGKDDHQALQDLLALAKRSVTASGKVLVAIENRLGLKYTLGACEDHYGVPYVGIDNYPESTGIRTYDRSEWQQQINLAGFSATAFAYPFPDYKVPTLLINDNHQLAPSKLLRPLANISSRDYIQPFDIAGKEAKLWQAIVEADTLGEFSNSYLILLGSDQASLQQVLNFDVLEFLPHRAAPTVFAESLENPGQTQNNHQQRQLQELKNQLKASKSKMAQLQSKLNLVVKSRGWRALNLIRALFGKPIIDK